MAQRARVVLKLGGELLERPEDIARVASGHPRAGGARPS